MRGREAGQATVEWVGLVLLVALLFAVGGLSLPKLAGWRLGAAVLHGLVCAVRGGCDDGDRSLERAYGVELAAAVREHAPQIVYERRSAELPIDFRSCRSVECSNGSDAPAEIDRSTRRPAGDGVHARRRPALARRIAVPAVLALLPGELQRRDRPRSRRSLARRAPGRLGGLPGAGRAQRRDARRARPRTAATRTSSTPRAGGRTPAGTASRAAATPATSSAARPASARPRSRVCR